MSCFSCVYILAVWLERILRSTFPGSLLFKQWHPWITYVVVHSSTVSGRFQCIQDKPDTILCIVCSLLKVEAKQLLNSTLELPILSSIICLQMYIVFIRYYYCFLFSPFPKLTRIGWLYEAAISWRDSVLFESCMTIQFCSIFKYRMLTTSRTNALPSWIHIFHLIATWDLYSIFLHQEKCATFSISHRGTAWLERYVDLL